MKSLFFLTLLACAYIANAISIKMDNKRNFYCCKVEVPAGSTLDGSYLVSGESEEQTTLRVFSFFISFP